MGNFNSLLKKDVLLVRKGTAVMVFCLIRRHKILSKTDKHSPAGNSYRPLKEKLAILLKLNSSFQNHSI